MLGCSNKFETLLLDVHGELPPELRSEWEAHLSGCAGCRHERERLLSELETIRQSMEPTPLPDTQVDQMIETVQAKLAGQSARTRSRKPFSFFPVRFAPALAVACCLMVFSGVIFYKYLLEPPARQIAVINKIEGDLKFEDLNIIQNFEILENMPTLEKLVRIVDQAENGQSSGNLRQGLKGNTAHETEQIRV
jgi:hypothetical protein